MSTFAQEKDFRLSQAGFNSGVLAEFRAALKRIDAGNYVECLADGRPVYRFLILHVRTLNFSDSDTGIASAFTQWLAHGVMSKDRIIGALTVGGEFPGTNLLCRSPALQESKRISRS